MTNELALPTHPANDVLLSGVTNSNRRYQVAAFIRWLGPRRWTDVDPATYRDYLVRSNHAPATVNKYLEAIYTQVERLTRDNVLRQSLYDAYADFPADDPRRQLSPKEFVDEVLTRAQNAAHPERLRVTERTIMHKTDADELRLTLAESRALIERIERPRDRAAVALLLATGLRVEEACTLKLEDLRQSYAGRDALVVREGKGSKQRVVLYLDELEDFMTHVDAYIDQYKLESGVLLRAYRSRHNERLAERTLTTRTIQQIVDAIPNVPPGLTPHRLRHSYARFVVEELGYTDQFVQQQLGHENIKTTAAYIGKRDDVRLTELTRRQS